MSHTRFLVIGAGVAGASAGAMLAAQGSTRVVEREDFPGYHTTGRSAAVYSEAYGNATIRALTIASRAWFDHPPAGFTETPLLAFRQTVTVARDDQMERLAAEYDAARKLVGNLVWLDRGAALARLPMMRPDYLAGAFVEPDAMDMDVNAIHQGWLRLLRQRGGSLVTNAGVSALARRDGLWHVATAAGDFTADIVVNAGGAWADQVAILAGGRPVGLVPKRRTVLTFDPPAGLDISRWPHVIDIDEQFYFKPESGRLLLTPADETPQEPADAQPEEIDLALAVDRFEQATSMRVQRIVRRWAGLRTFAPDRTPIVGFDADLEGFFWLAGQGGYGIMTSPALARMTAALATGAGIPADLSQKGVTADILSPRRFRDTA
jgi:D-arginine dehydrogenase